MAKLKDLIPDDKNFNKGTQFGGSLIEKSLRKFGAGRSILIDKNNRIIAGNKTVENAAAIGLEDVQIIETDGTKIIAVKRTDIDLDSKAGRELALADNATAKANIDWDVETTFEVAAEFDFDAGEWGVEAEQEEQAEAEEDDFDTTPPEIPITVLGDLYEIGEHRLLCGDSTDSDQVAKLMNGEKAELLFTSPPYSDMRDYNGEKDLSVDKISDFIPTWMPFAEYQVVNLGIQRKDNEIIQYWDLYIDKARSCGYKLMAWNVWQKSSVSVGQQSAFIPIYHEWIFVFGTKFKDINRTWQREQKATSKNKRKVRQADGSMKESTIGKQEEMKEMESVFSSNVELGEIRSHHPATFPVELPSEYIKAMTNETDIIVESFLGSGSTMVASHQLKRKCYGMELDPRYADVIVRRMIKLDPTLSVKRNGTDCKKDFE
jgi:DNA modification methylase